MITQLTSDMHSKNINCTIKGVSIYDAVIVYDSDEYYILQDFFSGSLPPNIKLKDFGKKLSWRVSSGSHLDLLRNSVINIQIINQEYELY